VSLCDLIFMANSQLFTQGIRLACPGSVGLALTGSWDDVGDGRASMAGQRDEYGE
jgi:hypothetical protein